MRADDAIDCEATDLTRLIRGYQFTQALYAAARLGLPDLVANGPQSVTDLSGSCGVAAPVLARLLRALTTLGVFAEVAPGVFGPTPRSQLLRAGVPGSRRAMLMLSGSQLYAGWGQLLHAIQTGETTARRVYGMDAWEWRAQHPEMNAIFNDAMVEGSAGRVAALVAAYDFAPFGTVVDVGGGHGELLGAILRANPSTRGILFDQPDVVAGAGGIREQADIRERCTVVGGSFFEAIPSGGDAYVLKSIIHDWDDESAHAILRTVRRAMETSGTLLLMDWVLPEDRALNLGEAIADLNMLVLLEGKERTASEFAALLDATGFRLERVVRTGSNISIVEGACV
jgi:hypothetical protein